MSAVHRPLVGEAGVREVMAMGSPWRGWHEELYKSPGAQVQLSKCKDSGMWGLRSAWGREWLMEETQTSCAGVTAFQFSHVTFMCNPSRGGYQGWAWKTWAP